MLYRIKKMTRVYGDRVVLDIEDLLLEKGKVYSLTGPNGAGKTTLLKLLSFLDRPSSGEIEFLGERVAYGKKQLLAFRRQVVQLDQSPIMFSGTVAENVAFGLRVRRLAKVDVVARVGEMLRLVGLEKFSGDDAQKLSGGETKRVALARALAVYPEVLICDEPSANVDNENQEMILAVLERINRERGTSIIFSTHYLSQGHRLADHTLLLQNGSLSNVLNENVYRGQLVGEKGADTIWQLAGSLLLRVSGACLPSSAQELKLWVDPEGIGFSLLGSGMAVGQEDNVYSGHLVGISRHRSLVKLQLDIGIPLIIYTNYENYRSLSLMVGDKLAVTIPSHAISCTGL
ncbi:energy-coupling factor ABC transporter ATP-binding protein [Desulfotalea psychrophila]|uniref:Related to ABC transporter, ATP-binding protein n=1 Tax=Desulfotalea psychrophila (strain LSv54 / DSM 12343) TaxID=177439 RepID=Q6ARG7_DESPS|nr:ABC transporter ATP-binding protein [Desulfotalea psychrophila]CAG35058.1 related to ABC transporter, ATP-binding protein [Desulfotalea psychrophila LSv54]